MHNNTPFDYKKLQSFLGKLPKDTVKEIYKNRLLLSGPESTKIQDFKDIKDLNKITFYQEVKNTQEGEYKIIKNDKIVIKIFKIKKIHILNVIPFKLLKGTISQFPTLYPININQVTIDISQGKVYNTHHYVQFLKTHQIKFVSVREDKNYLEQLKNVYKLKEYGYLNIDQEKSIALLFLFYAKNLSYNNLNEISPDFNKAYKELQKKIDPKLIANANLNRNQLLFVLRIVFECSTKKVKKLYHILSNPNFLPILNWFQADPLLFAKGLGKDPSLDKLYNIESLLKNKSVNILANLYLKKNIPIYDLIEQCSDPLKTRTVG